MTEQEDRQHVVDEALTWVGTPYVAGGDVKGGGVDCGMILVRVFVDLGLVEPFDPRPYPAQWHMHQVEEKYLGWIEKFAREITDGSTPKPGDIIMFRFGKTFSHGAIVIDYPTLIHAVPHGTGGKQRGPVTLVDMSRHMGMANRERKVYSIWAR